MCSCCRSAWAPEGWDGYTQVEHVSLLQAAALGGQWLQDHVTLIYIEVKREAASAGDAQQEGMVYYANDCKSLAVAGTKTLQPGLLLTVSTRVSLPCASCLQAMQQSLCVLASASCEAVPWLLCKPSPQAGVVLLQAGDSAAKRPQRLISFSLLPAAGCRPHCTGFWLVPDWIGHHCVRATDSCHGYVAHSTSCTPL